MSSFVSIASVSTKPSGSNCLIRRPTPGCGSFCKASTPRRWRAAFRRHAAGVPTPPALEGLTAIAVGGRTLRGSFDAFNDRKAAHMMSALRHADRIVLAHVMVADKSNEIPSASELIEALGLKGCLFTLDAEHCQKNCSNA
jgi:hypothetical protein